MNLSRLIKVKFTMKKIVFQLLFFLIFSTSFAQMQEIGELSSGRIIDFTQIINDDNSDIFGYILLYRLDHLSKEEFHLRFVVMDKNLNKISSTDFKEDSYQGFWGTSKIEINLAEKVDDQIIISLHDNVIDNMAVDVMAENAFLSDYLHQRYYTLKLEDFSLSSQFIFKADKKENPIYDNSEKHSLWDFKFDQSIYPTQHNSYVLFSASKYVPPKVFMNHGEQRNRIKRGTTSFYLLNKNFEKQWSADINQEEDDAGDYSYETSDQNLLILKKENLEKKSEWQDAFVAFDLQSGERRYKFVNRDQDYMMRNIKATIFEDHLILYNEIYEADEKKPQKNKQLGYGRIILNKISGEVESKKFLKWEDFDPHLTFKNKYGNVKANGYGRIYAEDFVTLNNNHSIIVAEGYKNWNYPKVLDFYVFKLNENFEVIDFYKEDVKPRKIKTKKDDTNFSQNGYFNYQYAQKLNQDPQNEDYAFLYRYNSKPISRKVKGNWYLGIITYTNGEFHKDELKLTHEEYRTYIERAKTGALLLINEHYEKGVEMRLENINY